MNGWITIGSKLDLKQLEKDLSKLKKDLEKYDKEAEKLTIAEKENEKILSIYDEKRDKINEEIQAIEKSNKEDYEKQELIFQQKIKLRELQNEYKKELSTADVITQKLKDNAKAQEEVKDNTKKTTEEMKKAKGFKDIKDGLNGAKRSMRDIVKSALRWGIAIFGIRSAYMFLRNAINTITQQDSQLNADITYMKNALAYTLEPVVRKIVEWAKLLMYYVGYIVKMWTGKNIFENANKSLQSANKEAKKLGKQLAGFDEMNILQDTSDSGESNVVMPSIDLAKGLEDVDVPEWLKWIVDNKDEILAFMSGVATGLMLWKLGIDALTATGIGLIFAGLYLIIKGILDYIKDPSWNNFLTILEGIALVVAGIAILMGGWLVAIIAVGVAIVAYIIKHWDKAKEILGKVWEWIKEHVADPILNVFKTAIDNIKIHFDNLKLIFKAVWNGLKEIFGPTAEVLGQAFSKAVDFIKENFGGLIGFFGWLWDKIKSVFAGFGKVLGEIIGGNFKAVINGILWTIETLLNSPIHAINALISAVRLIPGLKGLKTLKTFNLPRLAKGGIINQPGRGVMVGSAIAGERGQEAVIPLTDSQQMALLGEAIGKYITINATIPVYAYNRQVDRQIKKIQLEDSFASNR